MPPLHALIHILWLLAPNGGELAAPLDRAATDVPALAPLSILAEPLGDTWVVYHRREDWGFAFFIPPETPAQGLPFPPAPRTLSGLRVPRLYVNTRTYRADGAPIPPTAMPVDVAEYLFTGLIEGWLSRELERSADFTGWFDARAAVTMAEVPEDQRREAYALAVTGFGAHMLSIANELHRAAGRVRQRGGEPCKLVQSPLANLWERSFATGSYAGGYFRPSPTAPSPPEAGASTSESSRARGPWTKTRAVLSADDKKAWVEKAFGGAWTGRAADDFADLCGPDAGA